MKNCVVTALVKEILLNRPNGIMGSGARASHHTKPPSSARSQPQRPYEVLTGTPTILPTLDKAPDENAHTRGDEDQRWHLQPRSGPVQLSCKKTMHRSLPRCRSGR